MDFDLFTKRRFCLSFSFCCLQVDFDVSFQVLDELNYYYSWETYWPVVLITSYTAIAERKVKTAIGSGVAISFQSTTRSNRVSDAHRRLQSYCLHPGAWDTLALSFGGKQTSTFSDWWVGLALESATTGVTHDQARPGIVFCLLYFLWMEFSCKFSTNPWKVLLLLPKNFFACSSSLKGSCKLSTNVGDFARFFGSLFFACSFPSKESCKFSTHLGDFSCFRFWSFFFLLAYILWRKSASSGQILGEIFVASFEAFFCLALFVLKGSCSSLVQMLFEISLASSEAFLFACCNSLKGNLLQV